jgi:hypothetical protein
MNNTMKDTTVITMPLYISHLTPYMLFYGSCGRMNKETTN